MALLGMPEYFAEAASCANVIPPSFLMAATPSVPSDAVPDSTTPMQYGGHFLEIDRRLLSSDALFNVIFVQGPSEPYAVFVSDLPAQAFAWDSRSGLGAEHA